MTQRREDQTLRTARQAADAGDKRYFTGKPCCHGHLAERMVRNGVCVECLRIRGRTEKPNPEARKAATQRYYERNLDAVRERNRLSKQRLRAGNPEAERARVVRFNERQELKLIAQAGRPRANACELCGTACRTVFDHCHTNGHFRGWLCDRCNRTLGQVKDNPELLRAMANYLEQHDGQTQLKAA